jgi:two-component system, OmpR family, sensor histidine kinase KdpD
MKFTGVRLSPAAFRRGFGRCLRPLSLGLGGIALTAAMSIFAYLLHFNLSAIGSLYLLLVVLVALRWSFTQATIISVAAVFCLNYLFVPPIFEFQVADRENWIALVTFESAALLVSGVSSKLRSHVAQVELQRARTAKLYELSRAILLIDGQSSTSEQLSALIRELIQVEAVDIWVVYESDPLSSAWPSPAVTGSALAAYLEAVDSDYPRLRITKRVLKLGTRPIGAMVLRGWVTDSLLADAVASLAAVAIERARAIQKEARAEAERNTEQLRTAVLDGLAHGFKTPLTAIQTASSGLLEIDEQLTPTQAELVSIIDEQATALSQLTTRLLQTAALEATEVRLRRSKVSIVSLLKDMIEDQDIKTRARVKICAPHDLTEIEVDAPLIYLALLQLIDNAARYSGDDRRIDVNVTQNELETKVEVANDGPSIRPENLDRIFERFYRGLETSHGPSGTGLGLSIVKKTAEAHGGRAWVESGNGSTRFFVTIKQYRGADNV